MKLTKLGSAIALAVAAVSPLAAFATPVAISNGSVLAGVSDYGTLGSDGTTSPGILFDATGKGNYGVNDFLTPGNPFEGFYITGNSGDYSDGSNNNGVIRGFGFGSPTALSATSAKWTGSDRDFRVSNTYTLTTTDGMSVIAINTMLTNISDSAVTGVDFLRTLDPDPDVNKYGSYFTNNVVLSKDQACGTGPSSGQTICLYSDSSYTHDAGVSRSWTTSPSAYLAGLNDGNGDYAIGMGFGLGTIASGQSVSINYDYVLGGSLNIASTIPPSAVPEPGSLMLMAAGALAAFGFMRRRNLNK